MDATVRATCPKCRNVLRIPSQWVGQAVKCKKCGTVVRSRRKDEAGDETAATAESAPLDTTPHHVGTDAAPFDFDQPSPDDDFFPLPEPIAPPEPDFDPTGGADVTSHPVPPQYPGYPYPMPPGGYPPPGAYGTPPGYPYGPPPGYPYPAPPGYPQPGAYGPPPGYSYPMPPGGYPPPGAYGLPPGYPYGPPPGTVPPGVPGAPPTGGMPTAPQPPAPQPPQPPAPAAPKPAPAAKAPPAAPGKPNGPAKPPAAKAAAARSTPDPVPSSNEFRTDTPMTAGPRRYQRGGGKSKIIWIAVCLLLTAGMVTGAIFGAKYLSEMSARKDLSAFDAPKLVELLGSKNSEEREGAKKQLRKLGPDAEAALRDGLLSDDPQVVQACQELLAAFAPQGGSAVDNTGQFPRRMLFIHISKYMFLNPLTAAPPKGMDRTKGAAVRLAYDWNIQYNPAAKEKTNQLFILSDTAQRSSSESDTSLPMKNVVQGAYERFFQSSRDQDRIVVYFGGHVLDIDGTVYMAPIEGDPDEPAATLIPVTEFYDKLKACPATQKVIIWDVCRYNPQRGRQRPGSEPMTEPIYNALKAAPKGTEVIITCQPGQNALEFFNHQVEAGPTEPRYAGSAFLESVRYVIKKNTRTTGPQPQHNDPIPVEKWAGDVGARVQQMATTAPIVMGEEMAKGAMPEAPKQTVVVEGAPPSSWVTYDSGIPPAKWFDYPPPPKGAPPEQIAAIVTEFAVPPLRLDLVDADLTYVPFLEETMKDYKAEVPLNEILANKDTYKFQATTYGALQLIKGLWTITDGAEGGVQLRESIKAPITDELKAEIFNELDFWSVGISTLEGYIRELDAIAPMRENQSKRWQAHYDYACAVVKTRYAYMSEYSKALGNVRTERLPDLDIKRGQDSYKLATAERMLTGRDDDVQLALEEGQEAYERLIRDHKGTPWAIQAKKDKAFSLGLRWVPSSTLDVTAIED